MISVSIRLTWGRTVEAEVGEVITGAADILRLHYTQFRVSVNLTLVSGGELSLIPGLA